VPESQNFIPTSESTLAQLLDVDSQLSVQEVQLRSQLESVQEKRKSLQVVIDLFSQVDRANVESIKTNPSTPQTQTIEENLVVSQPNTDESPDVAPPAPAPKKGKKTAKSASKKNPTQKTQTSKTTKQTPGWQHYLREEFRNRSLPQAISSVLESEVERIWDSSAVVEAIFIEEIPQEVKKKVRLQINNLLAIGARENKWERGQQGCYTLSKEVAEAQNG
jgi:hypothetical protein